MVFRHPVSHPNFRLRFLSTPAYSSIRLNILRTSREQGMVTAIHPFRAQHPTPPIKKKTRYQPKPHDLRDVKIRAEEKTKHTANEQGYTLRHIFSHCQRLVSTATECSSISRERTSMLKRWMWLLRQQRKSRWRLELQQQRKSR